MNILLQSLLHRLHALRALLGRTHKHRVRVRFRLEMIRHIRSLFEGKEGEGGRKIKVAGERERER